MSSWLEKSRTGALVAVAIGAIAAIAWAAVPAGDLAAESAAAPTSATPEVVTPTSAPPLSGLPAFADIVERVKPAVVTIVIQRNAAPQMSGKSGMPNRAPGEPFNDFFERFFGPGGPGVPRGAPSGGLGSGFIIDPSGIVVTNNHVVNAGDTITVTLDDGTELPATVLGVDQATDLAVLKVQSTKRLPFVQFGDSDRTRIGDWVVAIGNPFGFGGTATVGIVSARGRDLRAGPYDDFLQIDAAINSGNSGGPVFDTSGRVIGVNTAIYSPNGGNVGIGFAIPAAQAQGVVAQLRRGVAVKRGWLGVQIQDVTPEIAGSLGLARPEGALIADVLPGGPAARAGLQPGDVVQRLGDVAIRDPKELSRQVAVTPVGSDVTLTVLRDGSQRRIKVHIGDQAGALADLGTEQGGTGKSVAPAVPSAQRDLGMDVQTLDQPSREQLGLPMNMEGVVVRQVAPAGPAASQGIQPGDVIVMVNQRPVRQAQALNEAVAAAKREKRNAVSLLVIRGNTKRFVAIPLR